MSTSIIPVKTISVTPKSTNSYTRRLDYEIGKIDDLIGELEREVLISDKNKKEIFYQLESMKQKLFSERIKF